MGRRTAVLTKSRWPRAVEVISGLTLYALALLAALVAAQSLLVADLHEERWWPDELGTKAWVAASTAVAFLGGMFALLATRAQIRYGLRPAFGWSNTSQSSGSQLGLAADRTTLVEVRNSGLGPMFLVDSWYLAIKAPGTEEGLDRKVKANRPPKEACSAKQCYEQLTGTLAEAGLKVDEHVWMPTFGRYGSIGAGQTRPWIEVSHEAWKVLEAVTVWVAFRGALGVTYLGRIRLTDPTAPG